MSFTSEKAVQKPALEYSITGKLWIESNGEKFFGPGPVELLENIEKTGSLNKAAKEMGMSYKKAWELVSALNTRFKKPMVIAQSGGENGGGSVVTGEAKKLIAYHQKLRQRFAGFLEAETQNLASFLQE